MKNCHLIDTNNNWCFCVVQARLFTGNNFSLSCYRTQSKNHRGITPCTDVAAAATAATAGAAAVRTAAPPIVGTEGPAFVGPMAGSAFAGAGACMGAGAANMTASLHDNNAFFVSAKSLERGGAAAPP
jgi:hypothetical protein